MPFQIDVEQLNQIQDVRRLDLIEKIRAEHGVTVLAEGDSWFAWPRKYLLLGKDANVIDHLRERSDLVVTNISSNGDEAVQMMSGASKQGFLERVASGRYQMVLFSGGGNDIVGENDFQFFLRPKTGDRTWEQCIRKERFERRLQSIRNAYIDLIELVEMASTMAGIAKPPPIITHTYDLALPRPDGAVFMGGLLQVDGGRSWMHPYLKAADVVDPDDQKAVVHWMLSGFAQMLIELGQQMAPRLIVVNTQGTLQPDEWLNEIHPTPQGFGKIAQKIYDEGIKPLLA
jgi:hypothetical protein